MDLSREKAIEDLILLSHTSFISLCLFRKEVAISSSSRERGSI